MSDKTFTVAGTSIKNGEKKNRFANGSAAARRKVLEKDNHTEILLVDLPKEMTQDEAIAWLNANGTATAVAASTPTVREPKAPRVPKVSPIRSTTRAKTGTGVQTFDMPYSPEELKESPVARAVHDAGNNEMVVSAEIESEAMRLHKESIIEFRAWTALDVSTRNEFRAIAQHCPKVKAA